MKLAWHLITGEYPPSSGGVADYTRQVATGLAQAGEQVHVWAPGASGTTREGEVVVHRRADLLAASGLDGFARALAAAPRGRLFIQYAPHGLGWRGANLPFAQWLASRPMPTWVMFHEVRFPWLPGARHQLLAAAQTSMASWVARRADRVFVATEAWVPVLKELAPMLPPPRWLPVSSNLPPPRPRRDELRARLGTAPDTLWIGHFGTYGNYASLLQTTVEQLFHPRRQFVLLGRGAERFARGLDGASVHVPNDEEAQAISDWLAACDLLLEPYVDGVTGRRSSFMAALASGTAVVSNFGPLSETAWSRWRGPLFAEEPDPHRLAEQVERLLREPDERALRARQGAALYDAQFRFDRTVEVLLACAAEDADAR